MSIIENEFNCLEGRIIEASQNLAQLGHR
jgi:hypothetical protein